MHKIKESFIIMTRCSCRDATCKARNKHSYKGQQKHGRVLRFFQNIALYKIPEQVYMGACIPLASATV